MPCDVRFRGRGWALLLAAPSALAACAPPGVQPTSEPASGGAFAPLAELRFDADGESDTFQVVRPPGTDTLALRVRLGTEAALGGPYCLQLVDVVASNGARWVSDGASPDTWGLACHDCAQRVFSAIGAGLYVFPNDGVDLPAEVTGLDARVALRDCATRTPLAPSEAERARLRATVEVGAFALGAGRTLAVSVYVAAPLALADATSLGGALLDEGLAAAASHWAPAGLALRFHEPVLAEVPRTTPADVGAADSGALDALAGEASLALGETAAGGATLILVPCLRAKSLLADAPSEVDGHTPRIPGGFAADGYGDAVLVRTGTCAGPPQPYWLSPAAFGRVVAHELGHYLGLYHIDTPDGLDLHLPDVSWDNLMHHIPSSVVDPGLTARQAHVALHHPLVR
ncbi:MAG: hypothetical protein HY908_37515 [Myxococcales bacterium]|nr:hypothetical protein [Myxococcales bacterium]